jgi:hypothetical protein
MMGPAWGLTKTEKTRKAKKKLVKKPLKTFTCKTKKDVEGEEY